MSASPTLDSLNNEFPGGELLRQTLEVSDFEGACALLLRERLYGIAEARWFASLRDEDRERLSAWLAEARLQEAVRTGIREAGWLRAIRALDGAGVEPIALKGFALARTLYASSTERPSLDMDVLIDVQDVEAVHGAMRSIGWELPFGVRGQYTSHQFTWATGEAGPTRAMIDFHWRITNRPSLSRTLTHNHVYARSRVIEVDGTPVRVIHPIDALLHAVIHIVAHHRGEAIPALWYLDIALLERSLSAQERVQFLEAVAANGISALCAQVWRDAQAAIGFTPSAQTRWLLASVDHSSDLWEKMPDSRATEIIADLVALRVEDRLNYLRELVLPNETSMRIAFGEELQSRPLWQLHLRRIVQLGVRTKRR